MTHPVSSLKYIETGGKDFYIWLFKEGRRSAGSEHRFHLKCANRDQREKSRCTTKDLIFVTSTSLTPWTCTQTLNHAQVSLLLQGDGWLEGVWRRVQSTECEISSNTKCRSSLKKNTITLPVLFSRAILVLAVINQNPVSYAHNGDTYLTPLTLKCFDRYRSARMQIGKVARLSFHTSQIFSTGYSRYTVRQIHSRSEMAIIRPYIKGIYSPQRGRSRCKSCEGQGGV